MNKPISVLIVDDHSLVRGMLTSRLANELDMTVVANVANAEDAIAAAVEHQPDLILMDIDMPGMSCFEAAEVIRSHRPQSRVVFLSAFCNDSYIEQAIAVQAWGYITKNEPEQSVINALRKVASGVAYFSPEVQARVVVDQRGVRLTATRSCSRMSLLTERETQVLRYLARGMSKKEIAATMRLSVNTVNRHATGLMGKLDIHDRVELARFAIREGLTDA